MLRDKWQMRNAVTPFAKGQDDTMLDFQRPRLASAFDKRISIHAGSRLLIKFAMNGDLGLRRPNQLDSSQLSLNS